MYSNFKQKVWYTPQSQKDEQKPVRFLLQTIPYRFTSLMVIDKGSSGLSVTDFMKEHCIIDFQNITTDIPKDKFIQNLDAYIDREMFNDIVERILTLWFPDADFMQKLKITIELMLDPRFAGDTWNCTTCQKRKLDKQRNCPLIEGVEHLDPMFKLPFMGETITQCPVSSKDEELQQLLLDGHAIQDSNYLPEVGGIGDQPIAFVLGTQHLAERIKYFNRQAEEQSNNASQ